MEKTFTNPTTMNAVEIATLNAFRNLLIEKGRNLLECVNSDEDITYIDTELSDENNECIWWEIGFDYMHIPYITYNMAEKCLIIWYNDENGIPILRKDYELKFGELRRIICLLDKALTDIDIDNAKFFNVLKFLL